MADTLESLSAEVAHLRNTLMQFMNYARPVIDAHQPTPAHMKAPNIPYMPDDWLPQKDMTPPPTGDDIPTPPWLPSLPPSR